MAIMLLQFGHVRSFIPGVSGFQKLFIHGRLPEMDSLHAKGFRWWSFWRNWQRVCSLAWDCKGIIACSKNKIKWERCEVACRIVAISTSLMRTGSPVHARSLTIHHLPG